jgi:hypothetical protein
LKTSNLILDFEFDQHLGSHKHVINIIMWFRDMGCYSHCGHDRCSGATTGVPLVASAWRGRAIEDWWHTGKAPGTVSMVETQRKGGGGPRRGDNSDFGISNA